MIDVEQKTGYNYPPNIRWDEHFTGNQNSFDPNAKTLTLNSDMQGGIVTITYNENLSDESYWAKLEYYNGSNGSISGATAPRFKKHGNYTIEELTDGIQSPITSLTAGTRPMEMEVIRRESGWREVSP